MKWFVPSLAATAIVGVLIVDWALARPTHERHRAIECWARGGLIDERKAWQPCIRNHLYPELAPIVLPSDSNWLATREKPEAK